MTKPDRISEANGDDGGVQVKDASWETAARKPNKKTTTLAPATENWRSWLWLLPIFTILPYLCTKLHYQLPAVLPPHDLNGRAQPSESLVLAHIQALQDIGYRTVGTLESKLGDEYVASQVRNLGQKCDELGTLKCEIWVQKGSGYHRFDIMDHEVLKMYVGITNVVLKISAHEPPNGKETEKDAILLGSHIDSTLPAPGAADDGMGVGVMLELARVLIERNEPFDNSVIFLWNGAEETLQDGSHLYTTQHETASSVRAMINLEAAGTTGGALLFQATSAEMIEAYAHSPHPKGTVIAADVFASGIILSDTDFGQFEQYLNVSGLDMATVGHSYFYHTRKDSIENIEPGSCQHFANNMIAILEHLLGPSSPLSLPTDWAPPNIVYFSFYDRIFLRWSIETATKVYGGLAAVAFALVLSNLSKQNSKAFGVAMIGTPVGLILGVVFANLIAAGMLAIDKGQSWVHRCVSVYRLLLKVGYFAFQFFLSSFLSAANQGQLEVAYYYVQMVYTATYMLLMQFFHIRSGYLFALNTGILLSGAIVNEALRIGKPARIGGKSAYLLPLVGFVILSVESVPNALDIFVPLTGRMGKDAPSEFIIATISSVCGFLALPPLTPLFHRTSRSTQKRILLVIISFTALVIVVFSAPFWSPYDAMHPRRVGVQYTYNHTSLEQTAHVAFMDRGPGHYEIVEAIHERYGTDNPIETTIMTEYDSEWDTLYPISSFLETYKIEIPKIEFDWPRINWAAEHIETDDESTRHLKIRFDHSGLVWPVLAFEAEILSWSFDFPPPTGRKRHHIKAATSVDDHYLDLELVLRMSEREQLEVHWSAIDMKQMVPGTASKFQDMPASRMLLEMDNWMMETWKGHMDVLMVGVVVGIAAI